MKWLFSVFIGTLTGVLSGFGIGGGTLLLLWLTLACGMSQLQAGGVNLLYFVCCALPALIGHKKRGLLDKTAIFWAVVCGLPTCVLSAVLAARLDTTLLRRVFGVFLLVVGWRELTAKAEMHKPNDAEQTKEDRN